MLFLSHFEVDFLAWVQRANLGDVGVSLFKRIKVQRIASRLANLARQGQSFKLDGSLVNALFVPCAAQVFVKTLGYCTHHSVPFLFSIVLFVPIVLVYQNLAS